jgi:hypothetical protein
MMSILGAAGMPLLVDDVRPADASNPRGYFEYAPVRASERDTRWLDHAAGRAVKVIHLLLSSLPQDREYRVILMERPIAEIVRSQDRMLERLEGTKPDPSAKAVEAGLSRQLEHARELLARSACFESLTIPFPELVHEPDESLERVCSFLGLRGDLPAMKACIDPTLHRESERC